MDEDRNVISSGFVVTPEVVASRTFTTGFRGFDQGEVRTFLKRVSEELAAAAEREAQLRRLLQEAQNKAAHPEVDEELLTNALGEHAARLLGSAREQAGEIRSEAEAKATRMLRDAENQLSRIRSEADSLLARRVEEVDGVTTNLRNAAEADARALREQAKADAEAEIQAAKSQGREMVNEARSIRERILADLARRRHIAEVQLDQLRAARERLLEAYSLVRRTLDEATQELKMAEVEARLAAEDAGRRAGPPPPPPPPPTRPSTGLDVGPQTGEQEAVPAAPPPSGGLGRLGGPGPAPSPPPPSRPPSPATPEAPAAAGAAAGAARGGGTRLRPSREPSPRPEPRLRPPTRPDESRPSPGLRRPGSPERQEREPAAPGTAHAPRPGGIEGPLSRKPPTPEPPSITPRPVPPPPARMIARPPAAPSVEPTAETPSQKAEQPDKVDALFARIKADRASVVAKASRAAAASAPPSLEPTTPAESPEATEPGAPVAAAEAPEPADRPAVEPPKQVSDESARARRDELLEPAESTLVRQLKRALQDEQNEVLDRLRRERRPTVASVLPPADQQLSRFGEAATPALADAARAGARFAGTSDESEAPANDVGATAAAALASAVVEPLRARLERSLAPSDPDAGAADVSQLSEAVSAAYRQWRAQELEPLARHHAADAFGRGAFAAYPSGTPLRWVVEDETPCPDCDDDELAGAVVKGEPYPTGQLHPPAHPGCRCLLVPAVP